MTAPHLNCDNPYRKNSEEHLLDFNHICSQNLCPESLLNVWKQIQNRRIEAQQQPIENIYFLSPPNTAQLTIYNEIIPPTFVIQYPNGARSAYRNFEPFKQAIRATTEEGLHLQFYLTQMTIEYLKTLLEPSATHPTPNYLKFAQFLQQINFVPSSKYLELLSDLKLHITAPITEDNRQELEDIWVRKYAPPKPELIAQLNCGHNNHNAMAEAIRRTASDFYLSCLDQSNHMIKQYVVPGNPVYLATLENKHGLVLARCIIYESPRKFVPGGQDELSDNSAQTFKYFYTIYSLKIYRDALPVFKELGVSLDGFNKVVERYMQAILKQYNIYPMIHMSLHELAVPIYLEPQYHVMNAHYGIPKANKNLRFRTIITPWIDSREAHVGFKYVNDKLVICPCHLADFFQSITKRGISYLLPLTAHDRKQFLEYTRFVPEYHIAQNIERRLTEVMHHDIPKMIDTFVPNSNVVVNLDSIPNFNNIDTYLIRLEEALSKPYQSSPLFSLVPSPEYQRQSSSTRPYPHELHYE